MNLFYFILFSAILIKKGYAKISNETFFIPNFISYTFHNDYVYRKINIFKDIHEKLLFTAYKIFNRDDIAKDFRTLFQITISVYQNRAIWEFFRKLVLFLSNLTGLYNDIVSTFHFGKTIIVL